MSPWHAIVLGTCALAASAAQPGRESAIRGLAVDGNTCWAVGDAGTILRSDDGGRMWARLTPPVAASFHSAAVTGRGVFFFGGAGLAGHPEGQGAAVVLRSPDGGKTFQELPAPPVGWLYGGAADERTIIAFGQASYAAAGGIAHTTTLGRYWTATSTYSDGFILAGSFCTPGTPGAPSAPGPSSPPSPSGLGCLVGERHRIVTLHGLAEPRLHPPRVSSAVSLRGVQFADEDACWCVGDNAAVFRSGRRGQPWDPVPLDLPPDAKRCADLEAIAMASPQRAWLAGGLIGVVCHTDAGGGRWQLLPAPGPGAIHALALRGPQELLAAGDAGRIWRSADGGKTWQLLRGRKQTDVLFIVAAGETTVYPAIVAHAMAGDSVAVLYATHAAGLPGTPPDQPLRDAAAVAGAEAVAALSEFPTIAGRADAEEMTRPDILQHWSAQLDIAAEGELLRQLVAAIRLYRPAVLAVGPDDPEARGARAENGLVSRLAREAARLAADDGALKELLNAGLKAHKVARIFVGLQANEVWTAPWAPAPQVPARKPDEAEKTETVEEIEKVAVSFDGSGFPGDRELPLELLAQSAIWRLPWCSLLDRPATTAAYRCSEVDRRIRLFTTGLTGGRLAFSDGQGEQRDLARMASIRFALAANRSSAAAAEVTSTLEKADTPELAALAADRLLLLLCRLLEEGKLIEADQALGAFLRKGGRHPLSQRMNVLALAAASSSEWNAQLRAHGLPREVKPEMLQRAAEGLAGWPAWCLWPPGRMLHAKALAAAGQAVQARTVLAQLAAQTAPSPWQRCALLEQAEPGKAEEALYGRRVLVANAVTERGKFDGVLDEPCWRTAATFLITPITPTPITPVTAVSPITSPAPLAPEGKAGRIVASIQAARTSADFLIFGVRLPLAAGRRWELDLAIDADRDAWTQIILHCDASGQRSARLLFRDGLPSADVGQGRFQVQVRRTDAECTLEIAVGLNQFMLRPVPADVWNFQVRAIAHGLVGRTVLYLQPQEDARWLPERYGLLRL